MAASVGPAPTVSISSVTNYNQQIATLNATVNPNGYTTSVKFQYKKTVDSTWLDSGTVSGLTGGSQSVYYNHNNSIAYFEAGTQYDIRAIATNQIGSTTSGTTTFTTWAFQSYERSSSGGTTFTIPTVTPTGGSAVAVSIYDIIMFGAGAGGCTEKGGGGGGYYDAASASLTGSRSVTTSVAAGAAASTTATPFSPSSSTTISGDLSTLTAQSGSNNDSPSWIAGYTFDFDPDGSGKGFPNYAYGGGGGGGGVGGNGTANSSTTVGGTGGIGVSITRGGVTRQGGAGGGGATNINQGGGSNGVRGTYNSYGSGGNSVAFPGSASAGQDGYIRFRYYAASALA
jgi:hypothetical protein